MTRSVMTMTESGNRSQPWSTRAAALERLTRDVELAEARRALADANDELLRRNLDATIHVADEDLETLRRGRVI